MTRIRVAPEYGAGPLWWDDGRLGPADPADLSISAGLAADLEAWQAEWDATLDQAYPPDSRFPSPAAEREWRRRGAELVARLQAELGAGAVVLYDGPAGGV